MLNKFYWGNWGSVNRTPLWDSAFLALQLEKGKDTVPGANTKAMSKILPSASNVQPPKRHEQKCIFQKNQCLLLTSLLCRNGNASHVSGAAIDCTFAAICSMMQLQTLTLTNITLPQFPETFSLLSELNSLSYMKLSMGTIAEQLSHNHVSFESLTASSRFLHAQLPNSVPAHGWCFWHDMTLIQEQRIAAGTASLKVYKSSVNVIRLENMQDQSASTKQGLQSGQS